MPASEADNAPSQSDGQGSEGPNPQGLADLLKKIPMGRLGRSEEIVRMAVFLASDAASYVIGTTGFVDGGMADYADFAHGGSRT